jgi:uncharacterized membrane protein YeiH
VTVAPVAIPLWADLAAVAIASMQEAIFAAKVDNHRIDLLGVGVVGTATGLGGAFIRDILLNVTPAVLTNRIGKHCRGNSYPPTAPSQRQTL